ncbi:Progonadoliberin-2, partial [Heterocephalus glaber]
LLLLLLLTTYPGPLRAQYWSHGWYPGGKRAYSSSQDSQNVPRLSGRILGTAAGSLAQAAHRLPSKDLAPSEDTVPWEGRSMFRWTLHRKQHL